MSNASVRLRNIFTFHTPIIRKVSRSRSFSSTGTASSNNNFAGSFKYHSVPTQGYSTVSSPKPRPAVSESEGEQSQPSLRHRKAKEQNIKLQTKNILDGKMDSWSWLGDFGPGYAVSGSQLNIIETPDQFYNVLIQKSRNAKKRITMATLYLGVGKLEQGLVETVEKNLEENSNLKVTVLLDYARGLRGKVNSTTMLLPLLQKCPNQCEVSLYHTPALRGARKKILPQRWNELVGLQHMKIYVFDNSILISGANLSNDYFTNRQDRYFLIENAQDLADFYDGLIQCVSKFSFQVDSKNNINLHPNWSIHPAQGDRKKFVEEARRIIVNYYENLKSTNQPYLHTSSQNDTWIFPLIQMGPFNVNYDERATSRLLECLIEGSHVRLATGYFNLTPEYIRTIIARTGVEFQILMAHPKANGFLGAKFPAGGIPAAYTLLATRFFNEVKKSSQEHIQMHEYLKPGWTFHAKGLWFYPPSSKLPFLTLIGSPNFGYRSVYRDLETQLYIVTTNESLRHALEKEQERLFNNANPFSDKVISGVDRIVPLWVHMVIRFFKNFF